MGGNQDFTSKLVCLTVLKHFEGEPFCNSQISGNEKIYAIEVMSRFSDFLLKIFCPTIPTNFVGEPFCAVLQRASSREKIYG